MKKIILLSIVVAFSTVLLSCEKDGFVSKKLTGTITEKYIDGYNALFWNDGADFGLFNGTVANAKYTISSGIGSRDGSFTSSGEKGSGPDLDACLAVAPYCASATVTGESGNYQITTLVPAQTTLTKAGIYDAGSCPMIALTDLDSKKIPFFAPLGGVSVKLTGEAVIKKVEITANGGEILNGTMKVTMEQGEVSKVELAGGNASLTLDCPEGIQLTQIARDFVFFIPAGTYEQGFTVKMTNNEGDVSVASIKEAKKITRARVLNICNQLFAIPQDLNEGSSERANCYIVSETGTYFFDATVKGNGKDGIHSTFKDQNPSLSPVGAKLVWEESAGLITNVSCVDGKIYFSCSGKEGNAVVAATDADGNIIWSWHIWSTTPPVDVTFNEFTFLDKNVGAENKLDWGMYYQWGRKDPFSRKLDFDSGHGEGKYHPVAGGAANPDQCTIEWSVAHPESYIGNCGRNNDWLLDAPQRYLWGMNFEVESLKAKADFKTIYDPCPAGYSVAAPAALAAGGDRTAVDGGLTVCGGNVFIPYASFIYNGGWGWWDGGATYATVWTCSTSWGNLDNGFRLQPDDFYGNYDRACGQPVRCQKR